MSVALLNKGTVLITRPEIDSHKLSEEIKAKRYDVLCQPFLKVIEHEQVIDGLDMYSGLVFTSRNAVRAYCNNTQKRDLPIWVVGDATADIARTEGFKNIHNAKGSVKDLKRILGDEPPKKPLLYIRGQDISNDLACDYIHEQILYHTEIINKIEDTILEAIGAEDFSHIVFFSTRTAEAFIECIQDAGVKNGLRRTKALCLGDSMVRFLSVLPWRSIKVADAPNRQSFLTLLD